MAAHRDCQRERVSELQRRAQFVSHSRYSSQWRLLCVCTQRHWLYLALKKCHGRFYFQADRTAQNFFSWAATATEHRSLQSKLKNFLLAPVLIIFFFTYTNTIFFILSPLSFNFSATAVFFKLEIVPTVQSPHRIWYLPVIVYPPNI